jgi:hypothetical protein
MKLEEQLNAIVRCSIYVAMIFQFCSKEKDNLNGIFIVCVALLLTYLINLFYTENENSEKKIIKPTEHNPFMNVQFNEYGKNINREAVPVYNKIVENNYMKANIEDKFKKVVGQNYTYGEVDDIFGKKNSSRQFYTMPVTSIPSKREDYVNWLYKPKNPPCKVDTKYC